MSTKTDASATTNVVVASTVMLSFISFWRAAAIVLNDLGSSAFYAGGIAEHAIGRSAPWFVLGVMLFSFAVRSVYLESSSMFVRGGVYVVVRDAIGPFTARVSVSALIFDYVLTGPISGVAAGQYVGRLFNELAGVQVPPELFAASFGVAVTAYFWRSNIRGMHESSTKALRIMQIMTVMVLVFLIWAPLTLLVRGPAQIPPAPLPSNLQFSHDGLGWFKGTSWPDFGAIAMMIAIGHSLLSMSGFETLAQVYREIAYPKLKNLKITGTLVCTFAVLGTGVITVLASFIIPDEVRGQYMNNLLGGLAMHLHGPHALRLGFQAFVVIVGALILSGAVNTSIIGANGVMNRIAEDGVLVDWFRKPHPRFGTTYRIIHLVAILQILTIVASRGNVYLLGEAYAFGVVWSFFMKAFGVTVLRFKRNDQEYRVPGNFVIAGREIPAGLIAITSILFVVAVANLFSKQIATIYGVAFTLALFFIFTISERINADREAAASRGLEQFNLDVRSDIEQTVREGAIVVAVRHSGRLQHLESVLHKTRPERYDIVALTVRSGEYQTDPTALTAYERILFTSVVLMAEKYGKHVSLLIVPGVDPFEAMVRTAARLKASRLVTGVSETMDQHELARRIGLAWERLDQNRHPFSLETIAPGRPSVYVELGPHPPKLWPEDVSRLHALWLDLAEVYGSKLHHRDLLGVALRRFERELASPQRDVVLADVEAEVQRR